jgi:hypothetical protein
MKIEKIIKVLEGEIISGKQFLDKEVLFGFASDLMSDVLTLDTDKLVLVTGLNNLQTIRTAEMADIECVVFVRNKRVLPGMVEIASEHEMVLVECRFSMFEAVSRLHDAGLAPVY